MLDWNITTEVWEQIPSMDGRYEISSLGRVRSNVRSTPAILSQMLDKDGYLTVSLCPSPGIKKTVRVHTLVASAFLKQKPQPTVNHKNLNKQDNAASNLEYLTIQQNISHAAVAGRYLGRRVGIGERQRCSKLTEAQVKEIRRLSTGHTFAEIGRRFGVSGANVSAIVNRRTWAHVS